MGTFAALGIAGSGMNVYRRWIDAVSDNLANLKKLAETYQGGGAHRVLQTSGHCWALASAPNPSPRTSALEGPGLTRGLTNSGRGTP